MRIFSACVLVLSALLSACSQSIDPQVLEQKYTNSSSSFMELDGNRIHYRDEGEGDVIVLIHGTASSLHTWDAWTESLKQHYRIIRMDLPGFGLTGPDHKDRYEVSDDVTFLKQFLGHLNIESAHFVGSSLGGRIAWQYALEKPEQVASLTLMNSLGYPQERWPPPIQLAQWPVFDTIMSHFSPRFMYDIGLRDVYFDSALVDEKLVDRYFELSRYPGNLAAFPQRVKARLDQDSQLISDVSVPTFVMWGQEDLYFPVANAYRFQKEIAQTQMYIFEDVGHLPMEEVPDASVKAYRSFLTQISY